MANQKDIKSRIKTVQNTQKVTKSMKLISIIKLKQLQNLLNSSQDYSKQVQRLIKKTLKQIQKDSGDKSQLSGLLTDNSSNNQAKKLFIVISSDRGLCGPFNSHLFKFLQAELTATGNESKAKFIVLGNKAINFIQKTYGESSIERKYGQLPLIPQKELIKEIIESIKNKFLSGEISSVQIFSNSFVSMVKSEIKSNFLLPFDEVFKELELNDKKQNPNHEIKTENIPQTEIEFEPDLKTILEKLLPIYIENKIYQALIASRAGELANRVSSMTAATDNANTLISQLTLTYNKARQASITQEISEIVAGAESLA